MSIQDPYGFGTGGRGARRNNIPDYRPREVAEAFRIAEMNKPEYRGVTIGDIHRAATLLANYAACLESHKEGLNQRLDEVRVLCADIINTTTGENLIRQRRPR